MLKQEVQWNKAWASIQVEDDNIYNQVLQQEKSQLSQIDDNIYNQCQSSTTRKVLTITN